MAETPKANLRVKWNPPSQGRFVSFDPAHLEVWLNDQLILCNFLNVKISPPDAPTADITFTLTGLEIDANTLAALTAFLETHGESK